ncbi:hypothetical protein U5A82_06660 [Sphingobium sp. CR2-8]|uniref:hypothetical protein n=1 Tax=Sphingobium sp. CR2-8 TaxID=1306534 RepID=UPI002DBADF09|nr:hypothetical protein [Sphingobium sp. CR2-8]MEC3910170.1 hypothetical protein [Sphingobium sp. CR2-8]
MQPDDQIIAILLQRNNGLSVQLQADDAWLVQHDGIDRGLGSGAGHFIDYFGRHRRSLSICPAVMALTLDVERAREGLRSR